MASISSWSWLISSCTSLGRRDISFTLIGSGDCFDDLVALRDRLDLSEWVTFTGRIPDAEVAAILSTADLGISPDPKNPLNDLSTMNKTMEYMAFGLPVVAFDLRETRVSAGDAGVYATPNDVGELARLLVELMDDESLRCAMGAAGRAADRTGTGMGPSGPSLRWRLRAARRGSATSRSRADWSLTHVRDCRRLPAGRW